MWSTGWRDQVWAELSHPWDLIVIGGGITGAGILREAARTGMRVLLVEQQDFAAGTSSRSSKLVHGGLRYLKNGEIKLTFESVWEREKLLKEGRGLINQLGFLLPSYRNDRPPGWVFGLGLMLYDVLAMKWSHRRYDAIDIRDLCPPIREQGLIGGYRYFDAQTDDARLVLRVIREAVRDGAGSAALNYAQVEGLLRDAAGRVCGVALRDLAPEGGDRTAEVQAQGVISATGAWADDLRVQVGSKRRLRRLRGSHLFFPAEKLPLRRAVTFMHPRDSRPVFAVPWEGITLFGTTDVDHRPAGGDLETDVAIDAAEREYLMDAVRYAFPGLGLQASDVQATLAGVRAVVDTGLADPSKESREYVLWDEQGLLTVAGGKLTTFRLMAHQALQMVRRRLEGRPHFDRRKRMLAAPPAARPWPVAVDLEPALSLRLLGRYGADEPELFAGAGPGELTPIERSVALWAELRWAARGEGVVHLDDLLLRRVRIGLLLPEGGQACMDRIRTIVQPELGWDDARWESEVEAYRTLWARAYAP